MREFIYQALPGRIVFGVGTARTRLADELRRLNVRRLLLIVSAAREPLARTLTAPMSDCVAAVYTGVRQHVPLEVADEARTVAAAAGADAVLSIGGGSATGTAKAVAMTTRLPVVAVPTTYAGSEVTPVWGLTDGDRKVTGIDVAVLPRVVIYDPELTVSLPARLTAASGFNALAHCVEAFWAPGRNPVTNVIAEEGIAALVKGLPAVVVDGTDLRGRSDALYGAYLAGSAFAAAGSGLHHKICHVLGGAYHLPHAETHAVVLPYVLAFNQPAAAEAAARIARAVGVDDAAPGLRRLADKLGVARSLRELGLSSAQIPEAVRLIREVVPADNPRRVSDGDLGRLLWAAWAGQGVDERAWQGREKT